MTATSTQIQIHEFSTGIRPERTADGGWVSLGFTGQYMNVTIDPIPYAVQRSIANKEFAVAEGASSEQPAIIGRVVSGGEESDWSVVAIVTRGRDEKGRSASVYRYFLSEGADSLCKIVSWIEEQRKNGQMPVFDPFETKVVGQPNISTVSAPDFKPLSREHKSWLDSQSTPIIIGPKQRYSLQKLDSSAAEKAKTNAQPVAWAFKVEALEQPGRFQIIQAASDRAYELLQRAKASIPQVTAPVLDEQAIKSAIRGLISSSRVKPEHVQVIADSLENTQIPKGYWKEIFDSQGATNALKQGIYSPQMVRLLTLKAIVIPETLPDYLDWLEKGNKQNDTHTVAAEFQSQLRKSLSQITATAPNIEVNITEGVSLLLLKLLHEKVSVENVFRLLKSNNGLWGKFCHQVVQNIENDLQLMSQFLKDSKDLPFKLTDTPWQNLWRELQIYWRTPSYTPNEKYQWFAKIFSQLGYYNLAAIFYQISCGEVPEQIFSEACPDSAFVARIYGLKVCKKLTEIEKFTIFFRKCIEQISIIYREYDNLVSKFVIIILIALAFYLTYPFACASGKTSRMICEFTEKLSTNNVFKLPRKQL